MGGVPPLMRAAAWLWSGARGGGGALYTTSLFNPEITFNCPPQLRPPLAAPYLPRRPPPILKNICAVAIFPADPISQKTKKNRPSPPLRPGIPPETKTAVVVVVAWVWACPASRRWPSPCLVAALLFRRLGPCPCGVLCLGRAAPPVVARVFSHLALIFLSSSSHLCAVYCLCVGGGVPPAWAPALSVPPSALVVPFVRSLCVLVLVLVARRSGVVVVRCWRRCGSVVFWSWPFRPPGRRPVFGRRRPPALGAVSWFCPCGPVARPGPGVVGAGAGRWPAAGRRRVCRVARWLVAGGRAWRVAVCRRPVAGCGVGFGRGLWRRPVGCALLWPLLVRVCAGGGFPVSGRCPVFCPPLGRPSPGCLPRVRRCPPPVRVVGCVRAGCGGASWLAPRVLAPLWASVAPVASPPGGALWPRPPLPPPWPLALAWLWGVAGARIGASRWPCLLPWPAVCPCSPPSALVALARVRRRPWGPCWPWPPPVWPCAGGLAALPLCRCAAAWLRAPPPWCVPWPRRGLAPRLLAWWRRRALSAWPRRRRGRRRVRVRGRPWPWPPVWACRLWFFLSGLLPSPCRPGRAVGRAVLVPGVAGLGAGGLRPASLGFSSVLGFVARWGFAPPGLFFCVVVVGLTRPSGPRWRFPLSRPAGRAVCDSESRTPAVVAPRWPCWV